MGNRYEIRTYHDGDGKWFAVVRGCESVFETVAESLALTVCHVLNAEYGAMKQDALRECLQETLDKLNEQ